MKNKSEKITLGYFYDNSIEEGKYGERKLITENGTEITEDFDDGDCAFFTVENKQEDFWYNTCASLEDDEDAVYDSELPHFHPSDFSPRELDIAHYLYYFLLQSENGCNTFVEPDIYVDDGYTVEELDAFINKFGPVCHGLEWEEDEGSAINVMYAFIWSFNLNEFEKLEGWKF